MSFISQTIKSQSKTTKGSFLSTILPFFSFLQRAPFDVWSGQKGNLEETVQRNFAINIVIDAFLLYTFSKALYCGAADSTHETWFFLSLSWFGVVVEVRGPANGPTCTHVVVRIIVTNIILVRDCGGGRRDCTVSLVDKFN